MAGGIDAFIKGIQAGQMIGQPIGNYFQRQQDRQNQLDDTQTALRNHLLLMSAQNPDLAQSLTPEQAGQTVDGQQSLKPLPLTDDQKQALISGNNIPDASILNIGGLALNPKQYDQLQKQSKIEDENRKADNQIRTEGEIEKIRQGYVSTNTNKEFQNRKELAQMGFDNAVKLHDQDAAARYKEEMDKLDKQAQINGLGAGSGLSGTQDLGQPDADGRFPDVLKNVSPAVANIAKQYADYNLPPPSGFALKNPLIISALETAKSYDPNFDASNYVPRQKMKNSFTSGNDKKNLDSINTAIQHLGQLKQNIDELNNFSGIATPLNSIVNPIERFFGDTRQGSLETTRDVAAPEVVKAATGKPGTQGENQQFESNFGTNASKASQIKNLQGATDLLQSRIQQQIQDYESTMGKKFDINFLSPKSRETLKKLGVNSDSLGDSGQSQSSSGSPIKIMSIKKVE